MHCCPARQNADYYDRGCRSGICGLTHIGEEATDWRVVVARRIVCAGLEHKSAQAELSRERRPRLLRAELYAELSHKRGVGRVIARTAAGTGRQVG